MNAAPPELELMLFESSASSASAAAAAGVRSFIVDWESIGKAQRQASYDTEIMPRGRHELAQVAAVPGALTWCRVNPIGPQLPAEVEQALQSGAQGLFLPMVDNAHAVERFLRAIDGRAQSGILVETQAALSNARDLARLPIDRVYFGLNDFAISRGGGSLFLALLDGSVERAREAFDGIPFGFGGVTAVDAGHPVPCARLIEEMARLRCQFSFMRRSFRRDVARLGIAALLDGVQTHWRRCVSRTAAETDQDHRLLQAVLREVCRVGK